MQVHRSGNAIGEDPRLASGIAVCCEVESRRDAGCKMLTENTYRALIASYRGGDIVADISESLIPLWCDEYYSNNPKAEVVQVNLNEAGASFSYLFDVDLQRAVVAFGVPIFSQHLRDASRMAGHPLSGGGKFHRGHLMAHSIGGGTDINLVPQLGKLNIGQFRVMERVVRDLALQNLRSLYFVRSIYGDKSQTPSQFEQCVVLPSKAFTYALHKNT